MDCYSGLKRKEVLTPATTGMDPEDTMLSETGHSQKDKYCYMIMKFIETESRIAGARSRGEEMGR